MNKTATGINILTTQANTPTDLYARIFGETGIIEQMQYMGWLIQQHLEKPIVIPIEDGDPLTITRDMLQGDFQYVVDSSLGIGVKDQMVNLLSQMLTDYPLLVQAGIADELNVYHAKKRQLEEAGITNINEFLLPEDEIKQNMQMKMQQAQQAQQTPQPHWSDIVNMKFENMPASVQAQMVNKLGFQATPQDFDNMKVIDTIQKGVDEHIKQAAQPPKMPPQRMMNNGQQVNQPSPGQSAGPYQQGPNRGFGG